MTITKRINKAITNANPIHSGDVTHQDQSI
jgi:hypothetical protein